MFYKLRVNSKHQNKRRSLRDKWGQGEPPEPHLANGCKWIPKLANTHIERLTPATNSREPVAHLLRSSGEKFQASPAVMQLPQVMRTGHSKQELEKEAHTTNLPAKVLGTV